MLEREHKVLAQALDATRHDMVLDGVVPVTEGTPTLICMCSLAETRRCPSDTNLCWEDLMGGALCCHGKQCSDWLSQSRVKEFQEPEKVTCN